MTRNASESRLDGGPDPQLKLALPPLPPLQPQSSPAFIHTGQSHLKLWNCIPFSCPIDSGAVSKTNGGFRKSILMKEKEQGKERYLEKGGGGGGRREGGGYEGKQGKGREAKEECVCVY